MKNRLTYAVIESVNLKIQLGKFNLPSVERLTKVQSSLYDFYWDGFPIKQLPEHILESLTNLLQTEGVKSTCYDYPDAERLQFPMTESSSLDVMSSFAFKQMNSVSEFYAVLDLYQNSDPRLRKLCNN